jgi:hypothetical protein
VNALWNWIAAVMSQCTPADWQRMHDRERSHELSHCDFVDEIRRDYPQGTSFASEHIGLLPAARLMYRSKPRDLLADAPRATREAAGKFRGFAQLADRRTYCSKISGEIEAC